MSSAARAQPLDPVIRQFCLKITASAGAVPDSVAGLLLRLAARVASLEQKAKTQALRLDQLSRQSPSLLPTELPPPPPLEPPAPRARAACRPSRGGQSQPPAKAGGARPAARSRG
jgi:hypothetical protein